MPVKKSDDFMAWYNEIVERADLADKRYPIKGMNIWRPYGWRLMANIDGLTRSQMDRTGHQEVQFPLLIPEHLFQKEADHIKGFGGEVFWVTHAGNNELEEKWLLRPTSETAMYQVFSLWVRSHADLPLKVFQICNVFRYETKQTRAFMRVREIHFFEAHTAHDSFEDAEQQIDEDLEIAGKIFTDLGMTYLLSKRPEWDKFAGADYSIGLDVVMPSGRLLQLGSVHQYKTNFSKPYEITYETESGDHEHVHQTTYGMSERVLGAMVGIHGDDRGIVVPPKVAPTQVVIVPILFKGKEEGVLEACRGVRDRLVEAGLRVVLDDAEETAGAKYYKWELKGVPLRLEIGPRDLENQVVMAAPRHVEKKKETIPMNNLVEGVEKALEAVHAGLLARHRELAEGLTHEVRSLEEAEGKKGMVVSGWCGKDDCATQVETALNLKTIGTPAPRQDPGDRLCITCGEKAQEIVRFAATY
jgi:prolyl-tRNA synthetase